jgi:hypothetical protein
MGKWLRTREQGMRRSRRVSAFVAGGLIAFAVLVPAGAAVAQEYGGPTGELTVTGSAVPGGALQVSGEGFVAGSVVYVMLSAEATGEAVDLGTLATDSSGAFSGTVILPDGVVPGTYTLSATGVTPDGATRVASADVEVASILGPTQPGEAAGGLSRTGWILLIAGIAVLAGALVGGGWWLFGVRPRRSAR